MNQKTESHNNRALAIAAGSLEDIAADLREADIREGGRYWQEKWSENTGVGVQFKNTILGFVASIFAKTGNIDNGASHNSEELGRYVEAKAKFSRRLDELSEREEELERYNRDILKSLKKVEMDIFHIQSYIANPRYQGEWFMPPENQNDAYARKEKLDKRKKELEWLRSTNTTRINRAKEEKLRIEYYLETRKSFEVEWKESELNIFRIEQDPRLPRSAELREELNGFKQNRSVLERRRGELDKQEDELEKTKLMNVIQEWNERIVQLEHDYESCEQSEQSVITTAIQTEEHGIERARKRLNDLQAKYTTNRKNEETERYLQMWKWVIDTFAPRTKEDQERYRTMKKVKQERFMLLAPEISFPGVFVCYVRDSNNEVARIIHIGSLDEVKKHMGSEEDKKDGREIGFIPRSEIPKAKKIITWHMFKATFQKFQFTGTKDQIEAQKKEKRAITMKRIEAYIQWLTTKTHASTDIQLSFGPDFTTQEWIPIHLQTGIIKISGKIDGKDRESVFSSHWLNNPFIGEQKAYLDANRAEEWKIRLTIGNQEHNGVRDSWEWLDLCKIIQIGWIYRCYEGRDERLSRKRIQEKIPARHDILSQTGLEEIRI